MSARGRCEVIRRALLAATCLGLPAIGCASTTGERPGGEDVLQAEIRKSDLILRPASPGPFPAVIMLHGGSRDRMWAERLREWGYLTFGRMGDWGIS